MHFPVGGFPEPDSSVRFRPILEDFIEMLILEEMVDPREGWEAAVAKGWEAAVAKGRKAFYDVQFKSAQNRRGC